MANGMEHVPRTLTIRKFAKRVLKPSFCNLLANRLAATWDWSSLVAPVHVIFPDDQIDAVV